MDSSSGFSEGHFDPLILANCQPDTSPTPLYGAFLVNRCVRAYRERASAAYARTQQNAQVLLYRGSCPPVIGCKVGLHKGFNADKAPDTPSGRVDDVVGGFQITSLYSVTEKSTSCRSLCMDFLPPSGGVFRLSFSGSSPGIPCRRSCGFQGPTGKTATKKPSQNRPDMPSLFRKVMLVGYVTAESQDVQPRRA